MKATKRYRKIGLQGTLLFFVLMTVAACSPSSVNWSSLKFWESKKQGVVMDDKAVNDFVAKIRKKPGNAESHYLLASYYQQRGRYGEAIAEYDKVISIDPAHVKAYNGKGICHDQRGEHREAVASFERAISLDGNLDYLWNNLCYSLLLQKKHDEAIAACRKALTLNEKNNRIRNNLALAYALAGQYDAAFREFEAAGNGHRDYAHLKMGAVYYDKAMFSRAVEQYRAALALNPASENAQKGLQASLELLKIADAANTKPVQTKENGETGKDILPGSAAAIQPPAVIDEAKAVQQFRVADKLYEKGLFQEAKKHYDRALQFNPMLTGARKGLAASEALARIAETPSRNEIAGKTKGREINEILVAASYRDVGIEVSNGNGKRHMARDIGKYLRRNGFKVVRLTNEKNFNRARGSIYYQKDYRALADQIAEKIPELSVVEEMKRSARPNVKVKVVLGKDLVSHHPIYRN